MTPEGSPRAALEPAASLTSVRVKRRKTAAPSGKRGDLTANGDFRPAPEPTPAPEVIVLPTPELPPELREVVLPFAETLLPELAAERQKATVSEPEAPPPAMAAEERGPAEAAVELEAADADDMALLPELSLPEMPAPERERAPEPIEPEPRAAAQAELVYLPLPPARQETQPAFADPAAEPESELEPELLLMPQGHDESAQEEIPPAFDEPAPEPVLEAVAEAEPEAEAGEDILDYWDGLRGARAFPALKELDRARVSATWPNTVLLAVASGELPRITRLGDNNGEVEYTATVIDWIMGRGRNSAKRGEPMEEEKRFAVSAGPARYRLLLLPMGSDESQADHVLCQLSRVQELGAVASLRRWLTG